MNGIKHHKIFLIVMGALILGMVILGAGIAIGIRFPHSYSPSLIASPASSPDASHASYFLNPSVTLNTGKHFIINFLPLKNQFIDIQKRYAQKTYIYFDYLNNASWVGLNEKDLFTAASTVKVPLAMALYKAVEDGKVKLTDSYSLDDLDLDEHFGDLYKVGADKQFTVEELVKIMLEQSDNTAMNAVITIFKKIGIDDPFAEVYTAMGWQASNIDLIPDIGTVPNYQEINLKTLTNMFLALYNATYLSPEHSEQILTYLSHTPFNDKIDAGVPDSITVTHKIGVAANKETFSDCGIVYAPNRNYVLCVGSNGGDEKRAAQFMEEVSAAAYQYVINN